MAIAPTDFDYVSGLVRDRSAIVLEPGKEYLVETRLEPVAQRVGFAGLKELIAAARTGGVSGNPLQAKIVDALTTNETLFFRDFHPFEALRKVIVPELIQLRGTERTLTIWSAACSTGQEPYSLAMLLRENFPQLATWRIEIVATDLSETVLNRAREGVFSQLEVNRGLPALYLVKYFTKQGDAWKIKDSIKSMVQFRPLNLIESWPGFRRFDLVFLRNVLIYFDVDVRKQILARVRECILPHGTLFLGTAETTLSLDPTWKSTQVLNARIFRP